MTIDGDVTLTNTTPVLGSYVLNNMRTNMFMGTNTILKSGTVTFGGAMTHSDNTDTVNGRRYGRNVQFKGCFSNSHL